MIDTNRLVEIRWHGRGGQGTVTSTELVAQAAISEGKYAQAFPSFGPERRGAPVSAFVRIDVKPIRIRAAIEAPDVVVVLDPSLLDVIDAAEGLKDDGILIINSGKSPGQLKQEYGYKWSLAVIDASRIAREMLGVPITNTSMVGALVKATGIISLESLIGPLQHRFGRLAEKNIAAMKRAYEETKVEERVRARA